MVEQLDPSIFSKDKNELFKFEQKPMEIDSLNKLEEERIKEKIEKREKKNRSKLTEKKKVLKRKKREIEEKLRCNSCEIKLKL